MRHHPGSIHAPSVGRRARDPRAQRLRKSASPPPAGGPPTPDPSAHAQLLVAQRGPGAALELAELYADLTRSAYWQFVEAAVRRIIAQ